MIHKLFHCWDCGARVIQQDNGKYKPLPNLQQVRFKLSSGAYMVNPFCDVCAEKAWTPERLEEFRVAIVGVMPTFAARIMACEGPVSLITGVVQ